MNSIAEHHVATHLVGAVQQHFNVGSARTLRFRLPRLETQDEILSILCALDDKIELNRRMNETLEAMARAIFRDWFVDFGPTRAKQEARSAANTTGTANNTARSAGGTCGSANHAGRKPYLAPEIWSLFPDRLDTDGKPEGWDIAPLLNYARLISGGTPKTDKPEYWNGSIAWASAKDVSQCGETFLIDTERTITEEGLEKSATRIIPALSTVVVARGATTGRHCMFGREIAMNQTCYALHSSAGYPYWLRCAFEALVQELVHSAHGSVFDTITTRTIQNANVVFPGPDPIDAFEKTVRPLFEQVLSNTLNSRTLAETRDLLIPKLMSGEVRMKDAEKAAEAAA
jgi:type I restriction enzyme S subunit